MAISSCRIVGFIARFRRHGKCDTGRVLVPRSAGLVHTHAGIFFARLCTGRSWCLGFGDDLAMMGSHRIFIITGLRTARAICRDGLVRILTSAHQCALIAKLLTGCSRSDIDGYVNGSSRDDHADRWAVSRHLIQASLGYCLCPSPGPHHVPR